MQIHELNEFQGIPGASDYFAVDDGTQTSRVSLQSLKVLTVTVSGISSLPETVENSNITDQMVVLNSELSNPAAQTSDWTVTTGNGTLEVDGTISGTTSLTLYLAESR